MQKRHSRIKSTRLSKSQWCVTQPTKSKKLFFTPWSNGSPSTWKIQAAVFKKFSGKCIGDLLFVEIFAGSARLSKVARDSGFQALPIDKTTARASQIFIAQYDLTEQESLHAIIDILTTEKERILAVHLAPACGTASRAREKKLTSLTRFQNSRSTSIPKATNGD